MNQYTVPAIVQQATTGNLSDLVANRAATEPDRITLSRPLGEGWQGVSAKEFDAEVRAVAKGLIAAGIKVGDRVAIMAKTRYEWTVLDFAIWYAAGVSVPIYETSSAEQVEWILSDSGAVAIIVETPQHRELVNPVITAACKSIWTITDGALDEISNLGKNISDGDVESRRNEAKPEALATLIYTSGTTGKPKGVQLTHSNFLF